MQNNPLHETEHYQITDHGDDWEGMFTTRFGVRLKPEFQKQRTLGLHSGTNDIDTAIKAMHEFEVFHAEQLRLRKIQEAA